MNRMQLAVRILLGGLVCGSVLGIFAGGLVGGLLGGLFGNHSGGLNEALLAGCGGGLVGTGYGLLLVVREILHRPGDREKQAVVSLSREDGSQTPSQLHRDVPGPCKLRSPGGV